MKLLEIVKKYVLLITLFLVPVTFAHFFSNFFDLPKMVVLVFGVAAVLLLVALKTFLSGKLTFFQGNFDFPLFLLFAVYLISAIFRTPNKMDAFIFPGPATLFMASILLYFLLNAVFSENKKKVSVTLFLSATLVSVLSLLAAAGILAKIPQLPVYIKDTTFSPIGGVLPQVLFLGIITPVGIALVISEKETVKKLFYAVSLAITTLALIITTYSILPGRPTSPALPDLTTSWVVAVEALKQSPILGMGPGNYLTAFNRFRPLSYNATNLWAVRFTTSHDFVLTLIAELGLLGFAAFALLFWKALLHLKNEIPKITQGFNLESASVISLALSLLFLILFPANTPLIVLLFVFLFLNAKVHEVDIPLLATGPSATSRIPAAILTLPVIAGILAFGYFAGRACAAEIKYKKAIDALAKNDGKATYDILRQAIALNPYVDRFHSSYAQINLALARAMSLQENLTDTDRNTVAQLIQQAIREGKAVVTLNPSRSGNWEVLARTYQAIIPLAQGADAYTLQTFSQAVVLDPINPNLRIALGGVYYALGRYDDAIKTFELAVVSKPDLANAHYNLGIAYREKGEIEKAIEQMNAALSLVSKDSEDYNLVKTELDSLQKKLPAKEAGGTENLTPPQPAETPVIKPPLSLPEEATPPITP